MKKLFIILALLTLTLFINAQSWQWAKSAGGSLNDEGDYITTDSNGNIYVAGYFNSSSIQFGNTTPLIRKIFNDFFIVKYDSSGTAIWSREINIGQCYGITTDINNNVYVTGIFHDSIKFGNIPALICMGANNIFLAKYDSSGNAIWAKSAGGSNDDEATGVTTDANSNVYITGWFRSDSIQFGNTPPLKLIYSTGISNFGFIAKYDSSGNAIWAINPKGECYPNCIITDRNNNLYMAGAFADSLMFSRNPLIKIVSINNLHSFYVFVAKYDSLGNAIWAESAGGDLNNYIASISTDSNSSVYLTGSFLSDSIQFGNTPFLINGSPNFTKSYIAKYNSSGTAIWAKTVNGDNNFSTGISTDASSNLYITGYFQGTFIQFGSTSVLSNHIYPVNPTCDLFLARYDSSGIAKSAFSVGGFLTELAECITTDHLGNVYISGGFESSPLQFGNSTPLMNLSTNHADFFIAKYCGVMSDIKENEISESNVIFPNPSNSNFTVRVPQSTRYIQIYNSLGQIIERRKVNNEKELNFEIENNGVYFVQIVTEKEIITKKVVINK